MEEIKNILKANAEIILKEIDAPTKAAAARVRKATLAITKAGREYRKLSVAEAKK